MIEELKKILQKNQLVFNTLKKIRVLFKLLITYFFKIFDFIRKDDCTKESIRCEYDIKNKNYRYTLLGKDTPTCCLTHLYEITRDVTKILNKANIDYFIMYGTLLGQVRHSETFIPWDTDVDIVVMEKDKNQVNRILKDNISTKYNLISSEKILKINFSKFNQLHADIYFWEEKDRVLIDTLNDYWVKNRVKKDDVFPLVVSNLYDLDVKVPKNREQVLKDTYGDDCLEKAYKKYAFRHEILNIFSRGEILNQRKDNDYE